MRATIRWDKFTALIRKPTYIDLLLSLFWLTIITSGLVGFLGMPGVSITNAVGGFTARYAVSGSLLTIATVGFIARFCKNEKSEAAAFICLAFARLCHDLLFIIGNTDSNEALQTSLLLFGSVLSCLLLAKFVNDEKFIEIKSLIKRERKRRSGN